MNITHETPPFCVLPTATGFFATWKSVCQQRNDDLHAAWDEWGNYTNLIFGDPETSVVTSVSKILELKSCFSYYHLDAVFFIKSDQIVGHTAETEIWLRNIRVAFEHENKFTSGLFKETSHLLTTRTALRVLVTYPGENDLSAELNNLATIIAGAELGDSDSSFLLITGMLSGTNIAWEGRVFDQGQFKLLH